MYKASSPSIAVGVLGREPGHVLRKLSRIVYSLIQSPLLLLLLLGFVQTKVSEAFDFAADAPISLALYSWAH